MVRRWEIGIGLFGLLFAMLVVFYWVPNDIKGAFLDTTRGGKLEPGDAFFPVLAGGFIGFVALIQIVSAVMAKAPDENAGSYARIDSQNLVFLASFLGVLAVSIGVLQWAGPFAVWLFETDVTYRQMVDTVPYKYIGFALGGFLLTFALITWAEGQLRWWPAAVSLALVVLLIIIFDILLSNIQLPPNADF